MSTINNIANTCVIYSRVSSLEQKRTGYSPEAQQKLLRDYASQRKFQIVQEYFDEESAKSDGRTHFNQMVAFLKKEIKTKKSENRCKILLVEKTDRLYRNLKDWVVVDDMIADIEIHFVKENSIISKSVHSSEKLKHGIMAVLAKNYIENLSEETRKGMTEKATQGYWPSCAPIGYINVGRKDERRIIVPDKITAPIIDKIFNLYVTGKYSLSDITKLCNEIVTEDGKFSIKKSTVHSILTNPIYYGEFKWNGNKYIGKHEPIIKRELFQRVQEVLAGKGRCPSKPQKHAFAFQGLLRCAYCGCSMVGEIKKNRYVYYRCSRNKGKCPGHYLREESLDVQIAASLEEIRIDDDVLQWILSALKNSHEDERRFHEEALSSLQAQFDTLKQRLTKLYIDKLDGKVSQEFFDEMTAEWRGEQDILQNKILQHRSADRTYIDTGAKVLELAQKAASLYKRQNMEEKRKLLEILYSNSLVKDGELIPNYRKPFDILLDTNRKYKNKRATFGEECDPCLDWLPGRDTQQNFFAYHFGFLMNPRKKNHPRTEYSFQRLSC